MVAQFLIIHQAPLAACIFVRPAVAFTREVNPFGMSELITHKVQIAAIDGSQCHQTDHLVQGYATLGHTINVFFREVPVHIGIYQTEDDSLVAHQRLVVTLTIRNRLLVRTAVLHFPENATGLPVLVTQFLNGLDPIIWDVHGHAIVETKTTVFELGSQSRHTAHLLSNSDGVGIHLVNQAIGQREIANGIVVLATIEVVGIATECLAQSMTVIEHRGDAVETEAIKLIFLKPITAVRK